MFTFLVREEDFRKHTYCRLFFDEADSLNITSTTEIKANFTWFVTSSLQSFIPYRTIFHLNQNER